MLGVLFALFAEFKEMLFGFMFPVFRFLKLKKLLAGVLIFPVLSLPGVPVLAVPDDSGKLAILPLAVEICAIMFSKLLAPATEL